MEQNRDLQPEQNENLPNEEQRSAQDIERENVGYGNAEEDMDEEEETEFDEEETDLDEPTEEA